MICVGCGHPVLAIKDHRGLGFWLSAITMLLIALVLAGLPILVDPSGFSESDGRTVKEQSGAE
jgi:hypothetical protein